MKRLTILLAAALVGGNAAFVDASGPDLWLKTKILKAYTLSKHVNPLDLKVRVTGGVAVVSGEVDEDIERKWAISLAEQVDGVVDVVDRIRVKASTKRKPTWRRRIADTALTAKVKSKLIWNRKTRGLSVNVDTENGVVTLTGAVVSEKIRRHSIRVAENTGGVKKVVDRLRVYPPDKARSKGGVVRKTGRFVTDTWITAKIKTTLLFNKEARDADIKIDTSEGVVTLSGTVKSQKQMIRLIGLVGGVTGVKRVESLLKIKRSAS